MRVWAGVAALLALLLAGPVAGIEKKPLATYAREVWTTRDGLPHNQVNAIAQTREGYLWFATWGGIVRYNGQEFRTYGRQNVPELRDNGIRGATVGPSGALVLATSRGGVSVLRGERWQTWGEGQGLSQDEIMAAVEDRAGRIWVATESAGVNRISNGQVRVFDEDDGLTTGVTYAIMLDDNGAVWVGTGDGIARIEGDRVQVFGQANGLPQGAIFSLVAAPQGGV
ncbi:MAG: ligand-binding sensor domain-containing protein [Arenimonas sp.]